MENNAQAEAAKYPGVATIGGINWTWSSGFIRREDAEQFIKWLDTHGFEHRGIYGDGPFDIRWR
jgi:hypothetical protein